MYKKHNNYSYRNEKPQRLLFKVLKVFFEQGGKILHQIHIPNISSSVSLLGPFIDVKF